MTNDDEFGRMLEQTLRGEADTVQPIGDGLQRIRQKVERRRARRRFLVPLTGIAGVAAVGTIAFAVFGGTNPDRFQQGVGTPTPTLTSTATPTATQTTNTGPSPASTDVVSNADNTLAIWPYATESAANSRDSAPMAPKDVAVAFVTTFGGSLGSSISAESETTDTNGDDIVTVTRHVDNGSTVEISAVHLHRWPDGEWSVVRATKPQQGFINVAAGDSVTSPLEVRGIHHSGGEDVFKVSIYAAGTTKALTTSAAAPVSDTDWSTTLTFGPSTVGNDLGSLIAIDGSLVDGGIGTLIAVPVRFDTGGTPITPTTAVSTPTPPTTATDTATPSGDNLPGYMTTFVGVKSGRIALFGTESGIFKGYLTGQSAGGGDSAPSTSPDRKWVYFLRGAGTCANTIARVPFPAGGEASVEIVQHPSQGYVFDTMSAGDNGAVTWIERECSNDQNLALGWSGTANGSSGRIAVPGGPPTFAGTPRLSPGALYLAVFYVSGNAHTIQVYDVTKAKTIDDTLPGGCAPAESCQGIDFDWAPDGSFVVLTDPSTLVRADPAKPTTIPLFASEGTIGQHIDLSKDGSGLLVWDETTGINGTYLKVEHDRAVPSDTKYLHYEAPGTW